MDIKVIRQNNVRLLIEECGGKNKNLAAKVGAEPSYISQLRHGHRLLGDKLARRYERAMNKPYGWMDKDNSALDAGQQRDGSRTVSMVPLIEWGDIQQFIAGKETNILKNVPTPGNHPPECFASTVSGNSMSKSTAPSIPSGAIIIADPTKAVINKTLASAGTLSEKNRLVLVKTGDEVLFRLFTLDGERHYLEPLNQQYETIAFNEKKATIIAVVVRAILEFSL